MSRRGGFGKLLAGLGIGVGLGLLLSPDTGENNRKKLKEAATKSWEDLKNVDLNEVKDNLVKEFDKLKEEIKDMDADKAKKIAKEQGEALKKKMDEVIKAAKEKADPVIEKNVKELRSNLSTFLAEASKKVKP